MLTGSLAVALISLCAAGLYAKNLSALRQTVRALAQERVVVTHVVAPSASPEMSAHLASFTMPSRLVGTSWDVQVMPMDGSGAKAIQADELRFGAGKVTSSLLSAQGFSEANYSLTLQPDGTVLWETMQTARSGEVVCWRGEWNGERMQGVITRQLPGQAASNFSFVGIVKPVQQASHQAMRET